MAARQDIVDLKTAYGLTLTVTRQRADEYRRAVASTRSPAN